MKGFGFVILIVAMFLMSCVNNPAPAGYENQRPNIIIIYTDDMNFADIGELSGKVLTPTIDSLMNQGIFFSNYYACSAVCSPSRYNMLTGRYASRSKALLDQFPVSEPAFLRWNVDIEEGDRTIAHVMKEHGYITGMVGKYHNLQNEHIQDQIPEDAYPYDPEIQNRIKANYKMLKDLVQKSSGFDYLESAYINNLHALALPKSMQHHNMDWITEGALDFIDKASDQPFFLYLATTLPHAPAPITSMYADAKITPSGLLEKAPDVQPGRNEVIERVTEAGLPEKTAPYTWLDDAIGAVVKHLDQKGILEQTVIMFASDHGGNAAKMTCYQQGVRVPAFVYWKNHLDAGKKVNQMVANIDFAPTIYELCGIEPDEAEVIDGSSLVPLMMGREVDWRESLYLEITYSRAVVSEDWKYIAVRFPERIARQITPENNREYNQEGTRFSANMPNGSVRVRYHADTLYPAYFERDQLYHLSVDKEEQVNLGCESMYQDKLLEMKQLLEEYVGDFPHSFGEFNIK